MRTDLIKQDYKLISALNRVAEILRRDSRSNLLAVKDELIKRNQDILSR